MVNNNMKPKELRQWIVNRLRMDHYEASLCKTSWITTFGRPSGMFTRQIAKIFFK